MDIRFSTGFQNALASDASAQSALGNSKMYLFAGARPNTANDASGTSPLVALQASVGTYAGDKVPTWVFTLSGTPTGSTITKVEMNVGPFAAAGSAYDLLAGVSVPGAADLTTTASNLAAAINLRSVFSASSVGAVVTVSAPIGSGVIFNSTKINTNITTGSGSLASTVDADTAATTAGVAPAYTNNFDGLASGGLITSSETWSGNCTLAGTATWFRIVTDTGDNGTGASATYRRCDGDVGTIGSGAALEISTTTFLASPATPVAVTGFQLSIPATYATL